jgi:N-acetylmuramic acid 6-phosphate etherase
VNSVLSLLESMQIADRTVNDHVNAATPTIARAATTIAARLRDGGRCFYQGAGTSGRLAVLDAAELGPTFGVDSERVVALIAGGSRAVTEAIEGAEDDANAAVEDLARHRFASRDALVGIAASGTTPYTLGGVRHARSLGAFTVAIVCTANSPLAREAELAIELAVGAEVLVGSTRLKAGTAQKLTLNMLSTAVMFELGLIYRGEMVAMRPTNRKLRERAIRIVCDLTNATAESARALLETSNWSLPHALLRARHHIDLARARAHLDLHRGSVAAALEAAPAEDAR